MKCLEYLQIFQEFLTLSIFIPVPPPCYTFIIYITNWAVFIAHSVSPFSQTTCSWSQLSDSGYNARTEMNPTDSHIQEIKT